MPELFVLILVILFSITLFLYKPLRLSSGLFFGASWMLCNAFYYQSLWQVNNLNTLQLATAPQWVQGEISGLQSLIEQTKGNSEKLRRFNLIISHLNSNKLNTMITIRLSWKNAKLALQQGQTVRLKVKFKPAHGLANIGGFSYQAWLRSNCIIATGYVINDKSNSVIKDKTSIRQQLFNRYKKLLPEHHLTPLLLALGFGSRHELNPQLWSVLQATGTGHLIAISGLHIGLVVTASYFLFMLFIRLMPLEHCNHFSFFQTLNVRYLIIIISLSIGLIYGYLAGYSLPTLRALLMLSVYWLSRVFKIKISIKRWLLLTLFLLTVMSPFSLFTASFWLSVYAVIIIFLTLWRFKYLLNSGNLLWRFIKGLVVIQFSLTVMLLPISAIFFQQVSLLALLANLVAVPWMSFVTIPLCLLSVLLIPISDVITQFLMGLCIDSLQVLWDYLNYLSQQTWAVAKLSSKSIQLFVLFGLFSLFVLFSLSPLLPKYLITYRQKYLHKLLMSFSVLLLFTLNSQSSDTSDFGSGSKWQLIVFDVGQGLSVLIKRGASAILYDTGASYPSGFTIVDAVILPYLQHVGVTQLDKVIISHSDNDHAGGLTELQDSIVINELIYNNKKTDENSICIQGESFYWQNLQFKMLWPRDVVSKKNDDSCVILITDGKQSVLLTGDITKKVEAKLLQQYPSFNTDILVVPHHGSKTSSSDKFITTLSPTVAVVSAGYLNRWNMPVPEVVKRFKQQDVELLTTAKSGQIIFNLSKEGISKQSYYRDLWPFWFAH